MKSLFRKTILAALPIIFVGYTFSCQFINSAKDVALNVAAKPFEKLSDYHFFNGKLRELSPNSSVLPYDLITPLFTDYAFKARFVFVPEGKAAIYHDREDEVIDLPVGSCLIKNFYYPIDFRDESKGRRIIETRLLVHREAGWEAHDYVWNKEQTEAYLDNAGDIVSVSWTHYDGTTREADYVIPNKNQCKGCHWYDNAIKPIGPKVRNLNKDYSYADGSKNQLTKWAEMGFVSGFPSAEECSKIANWEDESQSLSNRARAYLEANCAHCHNPKGPAYTSGLYLNHSNRLAENLGVCKSPIAAGKATGGFSFDIMPGHPEKSIMVYRMKSEDPGVRMPELGKNLVHKEGVALIEKWIASLEGNCEVKLP